MIRRFKGKAGRIKDSLNLYIGRLKRTVIMIKLFDCHEEDGALVAKDQGGNVWNKIPVTGSLKFHGTYNYENKCSECRSTIPIGQVAWVQLKSRAVCEGCIEIKELS